MVAIHQDQPPEATHARVFIRSTKREDRVSCLIIMHFPEDASDETIRLFRAIGTHRRDRALFLVAYRHGLQASEVGLLRVEEGGPERPVTMGRDHSHNLKKRFPTRRPGRHSCSNGAGRAASPALLAVAAVRRH